MRTSEAVSAMLCPVCHVGLSMTDRQGVEIDFCPQCRGVWLDRGELDKIIERSASVAAAPPPPQAQPQPQQAHYRPDRDYRDDGRYYQKKRKKSFLEELFD